MARLILLRGTIDPDNPLSLIYGNGLVWKKIFDDVDSWYSDHVDKDTRGNHTVRNWKRTPKMKCVPAPFEFPKPTGINVNTMPIRYFDKMSIPEFCRPYADLIDSCPVSAYDIYKSSDADIGELDFRNDSGYGWKERSERVAYLTIEEGIVPIGVTQRRPGLHIERPGSVLDGGRLYSKNNPNDQIYASLAWGLGRWGEDNPVDGIYMASNVTGSCMVYDEVIEKPEDVTDRFGGIEHMRNVLGPGRKLEAGELCWITDRTPHESLPMPAPADEPDARYVYRSFFRLVVGRISVWYSKHNTPNPLGVLPDCPVVDHDKFE